jgi:hypothetical protein
LSYDTTPYRFHVRGGRIYCTDWWWAEIDDDSGRCKTISNATKGIERGRFFVVYVTFSRYESTLLTVYLQKRFDVDGFFIRSGEDTVVQRLNECENSSYIVYSTFGDCLTPVRRFFFGPIDIPEHIPKIIVNLDFITKDTASGEELAREQVRKALIRKTKSTLRTL